MPTSGSVDYNRTAKQLIKSAMRGLGIIQSGEVPSHEEMQDGLEALELMIKSLQGLGYHLWTNASATLFLDAGVPAYSLSGARAVSSFVETTTTQDAQATDTTITVKSISGISDGDILGIAVNGTAIHWTTVNGAPSGSVITFTDALTQDVSAGATVYSYSPDDLINRPLRINSIQRRNSGIDTPLIELARQDYFELPNKTNEGAPTQFYYDPGRAIGTLYIWPAPQSIKDTLQVKYTRPIDDFDSTSNNPDLPQEWLETLKYQLMLRLAPEYGIALRPDVATMAENLLSTMMAWDVEPASIYFEPDLRW